MKAYAGIGSRETPQEILGVMYRLARALRVRGWTLRSGHAPGADQAFERGAAQDAEIYLPWPTFEVMVPIVANLVLPWATQDAHAIASAHHPAWSNLSQHARRLHARNTHQILGRDCLPTEAVKFVVCWTPNASGSGGTGQAIRLARFYGIEVFDLAKTGNLARVTGFVAVDY